MTGQYVSSEIPKVIDTDPCVIVVGKKYAEKPQQWQVEWNMAGLDTDVTITHFISSVT